MHSTFTQWYVNGGWLQLDPSLILHEATQTTQRGFATEGTIRPAKLNFRLNNASGDYDPENPMGQFYGLFSRYIPVAVTSDGIVHAVGEATFTPDQHPSWPARGMRWVDVEGQGMLRRVGQWTKILASPLRQWISGYTNLRGYWPMEDGSTATQLTNAYAGGKPGYVKSGLSFAAVKGPLGSDVVAEGAVGANFGGTVATMPYGGWQFCFTVDGTNAALNATEQTVIRWRTAQGYTYTLLMSTTTYRLRVQAPDGTYLLDSGVGSGVPPTQWVIFRIKASAAGSTVTLELAWYPQATGTIFGTTFTLTGTLSRPTSWSGTGAVDKIHIAHVFFLAGLTDDLLAYNIQAAFNGYKGEKAGSRFVRLMQQEGLPWTILGAASATRPMGVQPIDTLFANLKEIAATEDGLIFDQHGNNGIVMRTRVNRYNVTPLALTFPDHIAQLDRKIDTDAIANTVVVSQRNGGDATAQLTTGPLAPNANGTWPGVGELKKQVDVNLGNESDLDLLAGWWLNRLAQTGSRFPRIRIDADVNPTQFTAAANLEIGDQIQITGYGYSKINLAVIGVETMTARDRKWIDLTCVPGDAWNPAKYDDGNARYDSKTTTLSAALTSTATAAIFTFTDLFDQWHTTAVPYDVLIAGERCTVTAMGAVAGTGPYTQAATLVRSVNAVVKPQTAGAQVTIATPGRYAL